MCNKRLSAAVSCSCSGSNRELVNADKKVIQDKTSFEDVQRWQRIRKKKGIWVEKWILACVGVVYVSIEEHSGHMVIYANK